jgi:hypothetical protein
MSHCNARFVGGAISVLSVASVLRDSYFSHSYADMVRLFCPEVQHECLVCGVASFVMLFDVTVFIQSHRQVVVSHGHTASSPLFMSFLLSFFC